MGRFTSVSVSLVCAVIAAAADKHHGWQTGMVLDPQHCSYFASDTPELKAKGKHATFIIES
jgi:hypothetical protein